MKNLDAISIILHNAVYGAVKLFTNLIPDKIVRKRLRKRARFYVKKVYNFAPAADFGKPIENNYMQCFEIENGCITPNDGYTLLYKPVGNKRIYFEEMVNYQYQLDTFALKQPSFKTPLMVDECCSLALHSSQNYWHFTLEALTKLTVMEKIGYKGHYVVPDRPYITELLALTDVEPHRFVKPQDILCKKLYVPQRIQGQKYIHPEILGDLRATVLKNLPETQKIYPQKLYVSRIGNRKVSNEAELIEFLKGKHGFEVIVPEDLSVAEQIRYFHEADIVVTAHGANSTNVAYMRENTCFVELFGRNCINPCMFNYVKLLGLDFVMLPERLQGDKPDDCVAGPMSADFDVDVDFLDNIISRRRNKVYAGNC